MSFTNPFFTGDEFRARPATLTLRAGTLDRTIGDVQRGVMASSLTMTANTFDWSYLSYAATASLLAIANNVTPRGTFDAETATLTLRANQGTRIIGDVVRGASAASLTLASGVGGERQLEFANSASIAIAALDANFLAYWEAEAAKMPLNAVTVIVQIGDVTVVCQKASLAAIAPTIQAAIFAQGQPAILSVVSPESTWAASWSSNTATLTLRALQVEKLVGDRTGAALAASLTMIAPLITGTTSPIGNSATLQMVAPQVGFEIFWSTQAATLSMVAPLVQRLVGDSAGTAITVSLSLAAPTAKGVEVGYVIPGVITLTAPPVDYYAYSEAIAAQLFVVANSVGEQLEEEQLDAYEATVMQLDPSEIDVDLSDWNAWS